MSRENDKSFGTQWINEPYGLGLVKSRCPSCGSVFKRVSDQVYRHCPNCMIRLQDDIEKMMSLSRDQAAASWRYVSNAFSGKKVVDLEEDDGK